MTATDETVLATRLLRDRVLVEYEPAAEKSGLIFIPRTASADFRYSVGRVKALGPGKMLEDGSRLPIPLAVGDRVVCMDKRLHEASGDSDRLAIVQEDAVMAVVESDE
jgi:chaperonin GroES